MADLNRKMAEGHTVSDLDTVIDEVYGAHGDYDTLGDRLNDIDTIIDTAKLGIHYKGEVNYYSNLPTTGVAIGDAYTVKYAGSSGTTPDGTEYVWGTVSGTNQWINFSKDSYTKAEVDALLALKIDAAGTGLSKSGTTLNHSNSTTAKTTQGFAQIAYDAQGHITGSTAATTAQANAINSGIDSEKVEQIETNKNNILLNWETGRNVYDWHNKTFTNGDSTTVTDNNNGTYTVTKSATTTGNSHNYTSIYLEAGSYVLTGCPSGYNNSIYMDIRTFNHTTIDGSTDWGNGSSEFTITTSGNYRLNMALGAGIIVSNIVFKPMITPSIVYYQGIPYQPYAMSNVELTAAIRAIQAQLANT